MWLGHPKMIYTSDFKLPNYDNTELKQNAFTVILTDANRSRPKFSKRSTNVAARPLMYFASIFGINTVGDDGQNCKAKWFIRLYTLTFMIVIIILIVFIKPDNWDNTIEDIPLKILHKAQGIQETIEVVFFIFVTSFRNSPKYKKLYKILNDIDDHLGVSKKMFSGRRSVAIILIGVPIVELSMTFWLRTFSVHNLISHLIFFLLDLQGAICAFFLINMYCNINIFKAILLKKSEYLPTSKQIILGQSKCDMLLKKYLRSKANRSPENICWFELMQLYDKIADSMYVFNKIYNEQILITFNSWFVTTLLIICRILSPSVENSNIILSELLIYLLINSRPILLTNMSVFFVCERKVIIAIILNNKVYMKEDYRYKDQVEMMLNLLQTRKMEISTNVFSVNIQNVINFATRVISYAVLMIQYFYLYIHELKATT